MTVELEHTPACTQEHLVHIYEEDSQLVEAVARRLVTALYEGAAAIVIATDPHRRAIEAELEAAGIHTAAAIADQRLVMLDAEMTVRRFASDGEIDAAAFHRVIGGEIRRSRSRGRRVVAYGEMVGILWDAGDVVTAIELEKLWNDLGRELDFTLICGYRSDAVAGEEHAEALAEICRLHSEVVLLPPPPTEATAQFDATSDGPGAARHFVMDILRSWNLTGQVLDDAELVISELATNAVVHARSPFRVALRRFQSGARLSVYDESPLTPGLREGVRGGDSGHGLHLIEALAESWGVASAEPGKEVWAELTAF
jgi:anti-sigma regulatory factor (Ser/Thr protein kinase)